MNPTQAIKDQAHRLGFSLVGVTTCDPLPHEQMYAEWLDHGRLGEMRYLASSRSRTCRAHPQRILPECRSVLVLGVRYPAPRVGNAKNVREMDLRGRIASYAWGMDYHDFLPARLESLVEFIEDSVGHPIPHRGYTDTGPILERELAQRAGLGWIGKNTCLIHPRAGSYFILAEVLLGLELEPDPPFTVDRCGTCTRCQEYCPTGCILPDRTLDASRCISYLSIELKGSIPLELRPLMNSWVFGCDICQQVCPWNRFAEPLYDPAFDPLILQDPTDLLAECALSAEEFRQKYRHSPLSRAKRGGYLRNIAVALGNLGNPAAIKPLAQWLASDPEPLVRGHAAWALGQIGGKKALAALVKAASQEPDPQVMQEVENALANHM
ncbi:MAG TPA: tRNA epoxyqueuosine(34) reductase QueG [Anaerolineales bacterium]|nr:tRNA epoxyqueuosine(34) reductase QueG [Anaerolineales bacterium]